MKLKHILCMALGFSLLTACYPFKVDDDKGRDERRTEKKAAEGCTELDAHKGYRDCVVATAKKNSPKTYTTAENSDGEAIAIIKGDKPCTDQCAERWRAKHSTEILETEETETIVEQTPKEVIVEQEAVVETVVAPAPVAPAPVAKPAPAPAPVVIEDVVVPAKKDKTWWEQYQKDKKPEVAKKVVCPCPDPNDPCPQCVQK